MSYIIVKRKTGEAILEMPREPENLNTEKYKSVEAYDYLTSLNKGIKEGDTQKYLREGNGQ